MHGRSTCTCQCHLFWHHSSKVAPARHPWPARGDGIHRGGDKSQSTGPTIHWRNTPQSTGRTLLNPLAQHSSIHWPNTSQSAQRTLPQSTQRNSQSTGSTIHPRTIHPRYDLGGSTSRTFSIHPRTIHWTNKSQSTQRTSPQSTERNSQSTGSKIHPRTIHPRYDLGGSTSRTFSIH